MSLKSHHKQTYIPGPLQSLSLRELFLFTGIRLSLLESFKKGEFRANKADARKITLASMPFYGFNRAQAHALVTRKKFRLVRNFISPFEKEKLLSDPEKYEKRLEIMFNEHWDEIVVCVKERFAQ